MTIVSYSFLLFYSLVALYFIFEMIYESDKNHEENVRRNLEDN
jgi:phage shock protein PspC (stress-responsive transcriptional regulator)